jgi:hypothetical protein
VGHKPWDRPWKRSEKARAKREWTEDMLVRYADSLANDPEVVEVQERLSAALDAGDFDEANRIMGDPIDLDALYQEYVGMPRPRKGEGVEAYLHRVGIARRTATHTPHAHNTPLGE